jgi:hypothetical protein
LELFPALGDVWPSLRRSPSERFCASCGSGEWEEFLVTEAQAIPENSCKEASTATVNLEGFAADGGDLTVINDKTVGSDDVLEIYANVNGVQRLFFIPIALRSGTSRMVHVTYLQPVSFPSISLCKRSNTVGIVDSPDPVVSARMAPPPMGGEGDPAVARLMRGVPTTTPPSRPPSAE